MRGWAKKKKLINSSWQGGGGGGGAQLIICWHCGGGVCGRKINNYFWGIVGKGSVVEKSLIIFVWIRPNFLRSRIEPNKLFLLNDFNWNFDFWARPEMPDPGLSQQKLLFLNNFNWNFDFWPRVQIPDPGSSQNNCFLRRILIKQKKIK